LEFELELELLVTIIVNCFCDEPKSDVYMTKLFRRLRLVLYNSVFFAISTDIKESSYST